MHHYAALLSLSATAPTMPTGYTYKARVGWTRTATGSAVLLPIQQNGRTARYTVGGANLSALPLMTSGAAGSTSVPTWIAVPVAGFVPTTAQRIGVLAYGDNAIVMVAPNQSYGAFSGTPTNPAPIVIYATVGSSSLDMLLESTTQSYGANIYWASSTAAAYLFCTGWEDNI